MGEPFETALSDVLRAGFAVEVSEAEGWSDDPNRYIGRRVATPTGAAVILPDAITENDATRVVNAADQLSDFVMEEILYGSDRPVVWPECLLHTNTHPLTAYDDPVDGPWWRCTPTLTWIARIGELGV